MAMKWDRFAKTMSTLSARTWTGYSFLGLAIVCVIINLTFEPSYGCLRDEYRYQCIFSGHARLNNQTVTILAANRVIQEEHVETRLAVLQNLTDCVPHNKACDTAKTKLSQYPPPLYLIETDNVSLAHAILASSHTPPTTWISVWLCPNAPDRAWTVPCDNHDRLVLFTVSWMLAIIFSLLGLFTLMFGIYEDETLSTTDQVYAGHHRE